jgi:hypothetical protein
VEQRKSQEVQESAKRSSHPIAILAGVGLVLILAVVGLVRSGLYPPHLSKAAPSGVTAKVPPSTPPSSWNVDRETNAVTGEKTITAYDYHLLDTQAFNNNKSVTIRQTGSKLVAFVTTGEFLETADNMHTRAVPVIFTIDKGSPVRQTWTLSDDNTAVFYRGKVREFLNRLRGAKELSIQIPRAEYTPLVLSFDVSGLPDVFGH